MALNDQGVLEEVDDEEEENGTTIVDVIRTWVEYIGDKYPLRELDLGSYSQKIVVIVKKNVGRVTTLDKFMFSHILQLA